VAYLYPWGARCKELTEEHLFTSRLTDLISFLQFLVENGSEICCGKRLLAIG
jgi:hypothetical protein